MCSTDDDLLETVSTFIAGLYFYLPSFGYAGTGGEQTVRCCTNSLVVTPLNGYPNL